MSAGCGTSSLRRLLAARRGQRHSRLEARRTAAAAGEGGRPSCAHVVADVDDYGAPASCQQQLHQLAPLEKGDGRRCGSRHSNSIVCAHHNPQAPGTKTPDGQHEQPGSWQKDCLDDVAALAPSQAVCVRPAHSDGATMAAHSRFAAPGVYCEAGVARTLRRPPRSLGPQDPKVKDRQPHACPPPVAARRITQ